MFWSRLGSFSIRTGQGGSRYIGVLGSSVLRSIAISIAIVVVLLVCSFLAALCCDAAHFAGVEVRKLTHTEIEVV